MQHAIPQPYVEGNKERGEEMDVAIGAVKEN